MFEFSDLQNIFDNGLLLCCLNPKMQNLKDRFFERSNQLSRCFVLAKNASTGLCAKTPRVDVVKVGGGVSFHEVWPKHVHFRRFGRWLRLICSKLLGQAHLQRLPLQQALREIPFVSCSSAANYWRRGSSGLPLFEAIGELPFAGLLLPRRRSLGIPSWIPSFCAKLFGDFDSEMSSCFKLVRSYNVQGSFCLKLLDITICMAWFRIQLLGMCAKPQLSSDEGNSGHGSRSL